MQILIRLQLLIICIAAYSQLISKANAQENAVNLKAHVHGLSELTIVMEQKKLEIQLIAPAMDLVGFELL